MFKNFLKLHRYSGAVLAKTSVATRALSMNNPNWTIGASNDNEKTKETSPRVRENPFASEAKIRYELTDSPTVQNEEEQEKRDKRFKVLQLEADIARQEGRRVPTLDFLTDEHWQHILSLPTKSARFKYYSYLWQVEVKKASKERKKSERADEVIRHKEELRRQREENTHIIYGLGHCSLFLRIYDSTINHFLNNRLIRAMQFSPKLVIDCSYDSFMNHREAVNTAKQLMLSFAQNRAHDDPFDMHYCNVNLESTCMKSLKKFIPTMLDPEFPMNVHNRCFTELFPKENLVYLTPHCRTDLAAYNPDDVYIVGAMVDTVNNEPLSLAKAKKLGIRMARLPLDQYLQWGAGSGKSLTINQMVNIMLDLRKTGEWTKALNHVPRRKIVDVDPDQHSAQPFAKYRSYNSYTYNNNSNSNNRQSGRLNVRLRSIMDDDDEDDGAISQRTVRSHKEGLQFNLETWGSAEKSSKKQSA